MPGAGSLDDLTPGTNVACNQGRAAEMGPSVPVSACLCAVSGQFRLLHLSVDRDRQDGGSHIQGDIWTAAVGEGLQDPGAATSSGGP
jgi:hypothetical protein